MQSFNSRQIKMKNYLNVNMPNEIIYPTDIEITLQAFQKISIKYCTLLQQ